MARHNPERRTWAGRSYKKGGQLVRDIKDAQSGMDHVCAGKGCSWPSCDSNPANSVPLPCTHVKMVDSNHCRFCGVALHSH